jgi:hypothetical protein
MPSMAEILENPNRAEVSSYDPTWRDRAAMKLRELLGADQGPMSPETERLVSGLTGSTGLNSSPSSIFDLAGLAALGPVGGAAAALPAGMALTDAADYAGQGEAGKATMSALLGGLNAAAVPGVGQAVSNMPKLSTMLAAGGLGLVGGSSEAGSAEESAEVNRLQQLYSQQADLNRRRSEAEAEANAEARTGKGPNWQRAAAKVQAIDTEMAGLNRLIAEEQKRNSPEFQLEMEQKRKAADMADQDRRAQTPTRELYSDYTPYLPAISGGLGLTMGALLKGRGTKVFNETLNAINGRWQTATKAAEKALNAGNVDKARRFVEEAKVLKKEFDAAKSAGPGGEGAALLSGAGAGVLGAFLPEEVDFARAAPGSELQKKLYDSVLGNPADTAKRAAFGAFLGAFPAYEGAKITGAVMGRTPPTGFAPETASLSSMLKRRAANTATRQAPTPTGSTSSATLQASPQVQPTPTPSSQGIAGATKAASSGSSSQILETPHGFRDPATGRFVKRSE